MFGHADPSGHGLPVLLNDRHMHRLLIQLPARLWLLTLLTSLVSWSTLTARADIRCATVDVDMLLKHHPKTIKERAALLAKQNQYNERLDTLVSRRQKLTRSMTTLRGQMDQATSQTLQAYLERMKQLQNQHRALTQSIDELENLHLKQAKQDLSNLIRSSLDEIHAIIHQYAEEQQYHWVIETSGLSSSQMSPLIYARNAPDITQQVLAMMNQ